MWGIKKIMTFFTDMWLNSGNNKDMYPVTVEPK